MEPEQTEVNVMDEYFFCLSECDIHDKKCVTECVEVLHQHEQEPQKAT
jgi:hypothetical protein